MQWECLNIERIFNFSSSGANLLGITVPNEKNEKKKKKEICTRKDKNCEECMHIEVKTWLRVTREMRFTHGKKRVEWDIF